MKLQQEQTPWFKNPYVWLVISLPLTAIIAGIITIRLAVISDDGLVTDDYYKEGLEINRVLERDKAAEALGLQANINLDHDASEVRLLLLANADFSHPDQLDVKFLNATRKGLDSTLTMKLIADNTYSAALPELAIGHWYVQIEGEDWRILESLYVD